MYLIKVLIAFQLLMGFYDVAGHLSPCKINHNSLSSRVQAARQVLRTHLYSVYNQMMYFFQPKPYLLIVDLVNMSMVLYRASKAKKKLA